MRRYFRRKPPRLAFPTELIPVALALILCSPTLARPALAAPAADTVAVDGSGLARSFSKPLAPGEIYLLRASGALDVDGTPIDAEWAGTGADARDAVGGRDVGIDVGRLQLRPQKGYTPTPDGPGRAKWFGGPRADRTHYMLITGQGRPLALRFRQPPAARRTSGTIAVSLYALSPPPPSPSLGTHLDLARVPVLPVTTLGALTTVPGVVYVLQASGVGGVGGGGLKVGDAEYMDFAADGTRRNEGEGGVDFGIGVDEPDVGPGKGHDPRGRWWGPWRADHVYYMLFLGTGRPISFTFHDTGYGDNSRADALVVKTFAAP